MSVHQEPLQSRVILGKDPLPSSRRPTEDVLPEVHRERMCDCRWPDGSGLGGGTRKWGFSREMGEQITSRLLKWQSGLATGCSCEVVGEVSEEMTPRKRGVVFSAGCRAKPWLWYAGLLILLALFSMSSAGSIPPPGVGLRLRSGSSSKLKMMPGFEAGAPRMDGHHDAIAGDLDSGQHALAGEERGHADVHATAGVPCSPEEGAGAIQALEGCNLASNAVDGLPTAAESVESHPGNGNGKGDEGQEGGPRKRSLMRKKSSRKTNPAIFRVNSLAGSQMSAFPSPDSYAFSHNENLGFSMFLERRCKWVWFIRHAEAEHNLAEREHELGTKFLLEEHSGWKYWDAELTNKGRMQCNKLRKELQEMGHYLDWELCVVSPLSRTLQTARLTVGAVRHEGAPIKFIATEMCRERITLCPADSRRNLSVLKREFPEVDFSQVRDEEDVAWFNDKEDDQACQQRGIQFLNWLARRQESCIAVVTHSGFLKRLFAQFGMGIASEDMEELHRRPANCEMRGLVLCSHRQLGGGVSADLMMMHPDGEANIPLHML